MFFKLRGTPADYLIRAIRYHNNPQSAVLHPILRLLSQGQSGENENRNSDTANVWLALLLQNHLEGFVFPVAYISAQTSMAELEVFSSESVPGEMPTFLKQELCSKFTPQYFCLIYLLCLH